MNEPAPSPADPALLVHRILVPTDFSPPAERAVAHAVRLAEKTGAELHLLHIADPLHAPPGHPAKEYLQIREHAKERVKDELAALVARHAASGSVSALHLFAEEGLPAREIVRHAHEHDVSLVVIASSGHNGFLKRAFFGSTVEKVVRHATCPVLVVREKGGEIPSVI